MPPHTYRPLGLLFAFSAITLFGCEQEGIIRLSVQGTFEPDRLDFGEVPVDSEAALSVTLKNIGSAAFAIESVDVPSGFLLRGLKGQFEGSTMQPGMEVSFEVVFAPADEGERNAQLVLHVSDETDIALDLHGVGTLVRLPAIVAMPDAIDFGTVELGGESRATVTLRNDGNAPGTITAATVEGASTEFALVTSLPIVVPDGGSQVIELMYAPSTQGVKSGRMVLALAESVPPVSITISGEGRVPLGEILCEPNRVDFGPVERGSMLARTVTCTARGGAARLVGAHVEGATDQFFLPSPPSTSDLAADQGLTLSVEFHPEGLPGVHTGRVIVDFSGGSGAGSATVQLTGEVVPPPPTATAITVVLAWNTNHTDLDLHLIRPSSRGNPYDSMFESDADCYFANKSPDWNAQGVSMDNPFLDQDDVDGYGPETINLEETSPGAYDVFVHYYSDAGNGSSTPTVEIHIAGQLAGTFNRPNFSCNQVWHVGTINWNGTNGTFAPANDMHNTNEGLCF